LGLPLRKTIIFSHLRKDGVNRLTAGRTDLKNRDRSMKVFIDFED